MGEAGQVVFTWEHSKTQLEPELAWEMEGTTSRVGNPFVFYSSQHRCRSQGGQENQEFE